MNESDNFVHTSSESKYIVTYTNSTCTQAITRLKFFKWSKLFSYRIDLNVQQPAHNILYMLHAFPFQNLRNVRLDRRNKQPFITTFERRTTSKSTERINSTLNHTTIHSKRTHGYRIVFRTVQVRFFTIPFDSSSFSSNCRARAFCKIYEVKLNLRKSHVLEISIQSGINSRSFLVTARHITRIVICERFLVRI